MSQNVLVFRYTTPHSSDIFLAFYSPHPQSIYMYMFVCVCVL